MLVYELMIKKEGALHVRVQSVTTQNWSTVAKEVTAASQLVASELRGTVK